MENLVNLCMDIYTMERQQGRFYHLYDDRPVEFTSLVEALKKMNDLYDKLDFPQASTELRSFLVDRRKRKPEAENSRLTKWPEKKRKEAKEMASLEQVIEHRGVGATFIIRVKYRQNSSWQGEVTWVDGQKKEYFRSALELVKLLDGILEGTV